MGILTGEYPRTSKQRGDLVFPRPNLCIRGTLKTGMPLARKGVRKKEMGKRGKLRMQVGVQVKACCSGSGGELAGARQASSLTVINAELRL